MRKLLYLLATGVVTGALISSCDNEPKNPGDFSVKSTMTLNQLKSKVTGENYPLKVARSFDTIFKTPVQVWDTVWNAAGEFESRTADTIWVPAKFTTRYNVLEEIILPAAADTMTLTLETNAKWSSPNPTSLTGQWIYNEATTAGGGDGFIELRSARNRNYQRVSNLDVYVFTSDSTVFYKIPFGQKGEKDEE